MTILLFSAWQNIYCVNNKLPPLSTDKVILKIPDYINVDNELIESAISYVKKVTNWQLIITWFTEQLQPLAEYAHIIDINVQQLDTDELQLMSNNCVSITRLYWLTM